MATEPTTTGCETVRHAFTAALDTLIEEVKEDRSVLAAVLCGSLSHDTVWEKSDIDLVLVTIDDKLVAAADAALARRAGRRAGKQRGGRDRDPGADCRLPRVAHGPLLADAPSARGSFSIVMSIIRTSSVTAAGARRTRSNRTGGPLVL